MCYKLVFRVSAVVNSMFARTDRDARVTFQTFTYLIYFLEIADVNIA